MEEKHVSPCGDKLAIDKYNLCSLCGCAGPHKPWL
jgi:hypothetical protein